MATIMEPKLDQNGEPLPWDPTTIPSTKPFVNISTTAYEPLTTFENMNFVKTRSSIYSSFHRTSRSVNFEVGYLKDAKWFESLNEKWTEFSTFFVAGFLESVYEQDSTNTESIFAQIDAKIIDYDPRFRQQNTSAQ